MSPRLTTPSSARPNHSIWEAFSASDGPLRLKGYDPVARPAKNIRVAAGLASDSLDGANCLRQVSELGDVVAPALSTALPCLKPRRAPIGSTEAFDDLHLSAAQLAQVADHPPAALVAVLGHREPRALPQLEFERNHAQHDALRHSPLADLARGKQVCWPVVWFGRRHPAARRLVRSQSGFRSLGESHHVCVDRDERHGDVAAHD